MNAKARYIDIAEVLENEVLRMGMNALLPTEYQLAKRFEVSRVTIRRALSLLAGKGLVSRQRGRGTIANRPKIVRQILPICPIEEDLRRQGLPLETHVIDWQPERTPPASIRERLRLGPEGRTCFLSLVRTVDDRVLCHDERYIPWPLGKDFKPDEVESRSIRYILQELSQQQIVYADCEVEISPASFEIGKVLRVVPGIPIFVNTFTNFFEDGAPAEAGWMAYRIDLVKFKFAAFGMEMAGEPR